MAKDQEGITQIAEKENFEEIGLSSPSSFLSSARKASGLQPSV
jgi:hypothetical protein